MVCQNRFGGFQKEKKEYHFELFDNSSHESYKRMRDLIYPDGKMVLLCFSLISPTSLENLKTKWIPEVREKNNDVCFYLVGLKLDLRNDPNVLKELQERNSSPISYEMGLKKSKEFGCLGYMECSSLTRENLLEMFEDCIIKMHEKRENIEIENKK
eukprot:TRINITY_DN2455_c0_g1_i3.p1 TRINITY_DN2455_c0_g1~~TRINITY_DN2455_c0_g1_i3.p1  ORF type:complete len:156 (+),score=42.42 TRINITY_DN2455_c0_g1_i3:205-672(+)